MTVCWCIRGACVCGGTESLPDEEIGRLVDEARRAWVDDDRSTGDEGHGGED